jgi:hypothetical protein
VSYTTEYVFYRAHDWPFARGGQRYVLAGFPYLVAEHWLMAEEEE